jgi:hypothetical protein
LQQKAKIARKSKTAQEKAKCRKKKQNVARRSKMSQEVAKHK